MSSDLLPSSVATLPDSIHTLLEDDADLGTLLRAIRRHLHQHPEVGMEEYETSRFIRETLERYGFDVKGPVAETGLYVDIEGDHAGGMVGYRADIDALPTSDLKDTSYRSQNPQAAHLCGHDAHTAMGIGVALLLHHHRDQLHGTARVFFQPNEEGRPSGAPLMIRAGVLDGLDAVYALHVDPNTEVGQFGLRTGPATAATDRFDVFVRQNGTGHSARPHEAVDTVWVATQVMNAFYQIVGRVTDARQPAVLTICRLRGSEAHNVIPGEVEFGGTLRTIHPESRRQIREQMRRTAQHFGEMYGATVDVSVDDGSPPVINESAMVDNVENVIRDTMGEQAIRRIPESSMGGEDFAFYLRHVPGALIRVGTRSGPATSLPLHNARFDIDETALAPAARLMSRVVMRHLRENVTEDVPPILPHIENEA